MDILVVIIFVILACGYGIAMAAEALICIIMLVGLAIYCAITLADSKSKNTKGKELPKWVTTTFLVVIGIIYTFLVYAPVFLHFF